VCRHEGEKWRSDRFADHLFQWLPYAALNQEQQLAFGPHNFVEMLRQAAAHIYKTKKTSSRGELGELILHLACVLHFDTIPVMCKLVLKSTSNDTVKGFDGIHLVNSPNGFNLWLGESKFYENPQAAIRDAVTSITSHILPSFLTTEKAMVIGHIAPGIPNREAVIQLFKSHTSADKLLELAVFPVLIAYDSASAASFKSVIPEYVEALSEEVKDLRLYFAEKAKSLPLKFQLIFVPLNNKLSLVKKFDDLLEPFL